MVSKKELYGLAFLVAASYGIREIKDHYGINKDPKPLNHKEIKEDYKKRHKSIYQEPSTINYIDFLEQQGNTEKLNKINQRYKK